MFDIKDLIVFLILFGANLLQAITGFAGTLISMPPTIKLIGADEAKALLNAIAQISSLMIVVDLSISTGKSSLKSLSA